MRGSPLSSLVVRTLGALGLCAWCGWASGFHHSTTPALATWSASLAGVVVFDLLLWRGARHGRLALRPQPVATAWPRPGRGGSRRVLVGLSPWLVLVVIVVVWEVLGIDTGPHEAHLTISALALAFRSLDAALLLVWILVGLGYGAARARAPARETRAAADEGPVVPPPASSGVAAVVATHTAFVPALLLPSNRTVGVAFWVGLVVACVVVDLVARRSRGRLANAAELVRLISRPTGVAVVLVAAWTYAGWHLFAH